MLPDLQPFLQRIVLILAYINRFIFFHRLGYSGAAAEYRAFYGAFYF